MAILRSPMMYSRTPTCMRFYAHMDGANIGSLTVLINKRGSSGVIAYRKDGEQCKDWFEVMVDLPVEQSFSVSIIIIIPR